MFSFFQGFKESKHNEIHMDEKVQETFPGFEEVSDQALNTQPTEWKRRTHYLFIYIGKSSQRSPSSDRMSKAFTDVLRE